jgi:prepilin-type N-terminal cleavage/methylation domain-containing protein
MQTMKCSGSRGARGYTMVEVVIAMTLFAIGGAGVLAMQGASVKGHADARNLTTATNVSRVWLERLRRDGLVWGTLDSTGAARNLTATRWMQGANGAVTTGWTTPPNAGPTQWINVGPPEEHQSPAFDIRGLDQPEGGEKVFFCAQYRLEAVQFDTSTPPQPKLVRAEVRVFWPRNLDVAKSATFCRSAGDALVDDAVEAPKAYHFVYAATVIRENRQ